MQLAAAPPQSGDASVLYSTLSGEEILQQWLTKHPEVVKKYQSSKAAGAKKKEREAGKSEGFNRTQSEWQSAPVTLQEQLPLDLQPYRDNLPPSLLPPQLQSQYPGVTEDTEWG